MGWFKRKPDLISERARALSDEIAALESQIQKLDAQLVTNQAQPKLRSTAIPHATTVTRTTTIPLNDHSSPAAILHEPIFENVPLDRLNNRADPQTTREHYNELGVRKYDLPALLGRLRNHFRGPATTNPKLVNYLAAGGIQGLRPLRYEKRVARNRFIALVIILMAVLLGLIAAFVRRP